jgi:hypothetical protein
MEKGKKTYSFWQEHLFYLVNILISQTEELILVSKHNAAQHHPNSSL